jgi:hypothetical protein
MMRHAIARALDDRDPDFWDRWSKEQRRTDEERAFLIESGMGRERQSR